MKIKSISFSNFIIGSRFQKATNLRLKQYLQLKKENVLDECRHYSELDLDKDYYDIFEKYIDFYGFAKWSWKPYIILKELQNMANGDFLIYLDTGSIFNEKFSDKRNYLEDLYAKINQHYLKIGISYLYKGRNYLGDQKYILDKFNLFKNEDFYNNFNHYEAGVIFIIKNQITVDFIQKWYDFYLDNIDEMFDQPNDIRFKRISEDLRNDHDDSDQTILHGIIYTEKSDLYDFCSDNLFYGNCSGFIKYARYKD